MRVGRQEGKCTPTSLPRPSGLDCTKTHAKPWRIQSTSARTTRPRLHAFPANAAPALSSGEATRAAELPDFKAGRAWRRLARKLRAAWGPCSENRTGLGSRGDAAPHWLEPACPPPSVAARQGTPDLESVVAGERSSWLAVAGGSSGWAGGWRPGKDLLGKGSPFAFTCHRGLARRSRWPPAVGSTLSRL
ncbi:hypothetical protein NN561_012145 [Cricetulus griseus]